MLRRMPPLAPPLPTPTAPLAESFPPGVRAVVFDVVHTLVEPWPSVAVAYHEAGARHGVDLDPAVIQPRFRAAWRRQEELDAANTPPFATGRGREADRWRQIVAEVFAGAAAIDRIFADRASSSGSMQYEQYEQIQRTVSKFIDVLKENINNFSAGDYGRARTFLDSIANEARFPAG